MDEIDRELGRVPQRRVRIDPEKATERLRDAITDRRARGLRDDAPVQNGDPPGLIDPGGPLAPTTFEELEADFQDALGAQAKEDQPILAASLSVPDEEIDRQRARLHDVGHQQAIHERLERGALRRVGVLVDQVRTAASLEEAAVFLLAELQPSEQDAVRTLASENDDPVWVIMMGAVRRMAQLGELVAGEFDPEWRNRDPRRASAPREQLCKVCAGRLPPEYPKGASACCNAHGAGRVDHTAVMLNGKLEPCPLAFLVLSGGQWVDLRTTTSGTGTTTRPMTS